jgi:hypothetical protein
MRRNPLTHGWIITASWVLCLLLAGCIPFVPVYYTYPTVSHVSGVAVEAPREEVRAFRVDVLDHSTCMHCPAQSKVALDYGWIWNGIALIYDGNTHHTLRVRLYRPGWQTVEIKPWEKTAVVKWTPAPDLAAQEQALDDLLSTWETDFIGQCRLLDRAGTNPEPPRDSSRFRFLATGSVSAQHRQVLLFAAAEYERLAGLVVEEQATQATFDRLISKANKLKEWAEE